MSFTRADLEKLKCEVGQRLSEKRYLHTLGVAECAVRLAELCLPECRKYAEAAGLLHDITKELPIEEQYTLLSLSGEAVNQVSWCDLSGQGWFWRQNCLAVP